MQPTFNANKNFTCERCCFGTGEHAEWCGKKEIPPIVDFVPLEPVTTPWPDDMDIYTNGRMFRLVVQPKAVFKFQVIEFPEHNSGFAGNDLWETLCAAIKAA